MKENAKRATAALSAMMLVTGAAAAAVPAIASADQAPAAIEQQVADGENAPAAAVEGTFSYTQNTVSTIEYIKSVFARAASACQSGPVYKLFMIGDEVAVTGPNGTFFATVEQIAADEETASFLLGCACSSNVAGGGAVINAEVEGVSMASVAALAGAL